MIKEIKAINLKVEGMGVVGDSGYREEREGRNDIIVIKSWIIMKCNVKILNT